MLILVCFFKWILISFYIYDFYITDSYLKAREKLRKAEETSASDLQTEPEVTDHNVNSQKRKIR